ncbi:MAG: CDP-diacylglycerol--serine O-phosphatidyltransferase [Candidatus Omnitrophota bacterium]|jgi:CDP-diacylglycerol--serine O-phosphatidyltransferase
MLSKTLIPNIITAGNMVCGLAAIALGVSGWPLLGGYLIFLGMILDFFDGKVARLTNAVSRFGAYLDSVTDIITFGIAPVVLVFVISPVKYRFVISCFLIIYTVCGAYRLIRFTRDVQTKKGEMFTGMPIPAAAGVLMSYLLLYQHAHMPYSYVWMAFFLLGNSALMVSRLPYFHFAKLLDLIPGMSKAGAGICMMLFIWFGYYYAIFFVLFALYAVFGIQWPVRQFLFGKLLPNR